MKISGQKVENSLKILGKLSFPHVSLWHFWACWTHDMGHYVWPEPWCQTHSSLWLQLPPEPVNRGLKNLGSVSMEESQGPLSSTLHPDSWVQITENKFTELTFRGGMETGIWVLACKLLPSWLLHLWYWINSVILPFPFAIWKYLCFTFLIGILKDKINTLKSNLRFSFFEKRPSVNPENMCLPGKL